MAKFDSKFDSKFATKPLYAGVGATDLAVERLRGFVTAAQKRTQQRVADAQKNVRKIEREPRALRDQALTQVNARVDALAKDASGTFDGLVSRGESLVTRIRRQQSTQATTSSARTAAAKVKTTRTQASNATESTAATAKKSAAATKKAAADESAAATSSAKATGTAAKQTASNAAQATSDAAAKVGD